MQVTMTDIYYKVKHGITQDSLSQRMVSIQVTLFKI